MTEHGRPRGTMHDTDSVAGCSTRTAACAAPRRPHRPAVRRRHPRRRPAPAPACWTPPCAACGWALLDRGDFASGTSSVSSKLVHGGLRHLEHGDLHLVYEALHERRRLLANAPHLVWPLPFVIPFYAGARVPGWKWRAGLVLYDLLAGAGNLRRSPPVQLPRLRARSPACAPPACTAGPRTPTPAWTTPGCAWRSSAPRAARRRRQPCRGGGVRPLPRTGLRARGRPADRPRAGGARHARSSTPPARGAIASAGWPARTANRRAPTKGVHLVAGPRPAAALVLLHPRDGRVFFVLPWQDRTVIGTTDTELTGPADDLAVTDADIAYLLDGHNHFFDPPLQRTDLLGTFAGAAAGRGCGRAIRRRGRAEHVLVDGSAGLLSVVGGKWTTYRRMAEEITDRVMRRLGRRGRCRTATFRLDGAPRQPWAEWRPDAIRSLTRGGLSAEAAQHLVDRYGRRAFDVAACAARDPRSATAPRRRARPGAPRSSTSREHEMACTPDDHLLRRTHLGLFYPDAVEALTKRIADPGAE
ncbi:MAG: FAD-dependent oxidoreductase [Gemmataceae bacterium]